MNDAAGNGPDDWEKVVRHGVLHEPRLDLLRDQARALGWRCVVIDLDGCASKADLLERLARALDFPLWFGGNWDALFDCLSDAGVATAPGLLLVLKNAAGLRQGAPEVFDTVSAIVTDAAASLAARATTLRMWIDLPPGEAPTPA